MFDFSHKMLNLLISSFVCLFLFLFPVFVIVGMVAACADPEGVQGVRTPPPEKSQNIGSLSNTGPDPLKKNKSI